MKNTVRNRKIARQLYALMLLILVQIPLRADIDDRIEYKVIRLLEVLDTINNQLAGVSDPVMKQGSTKNQAQKKAAYKKRIVSRK